MDWLDKASDESKEWYHSRPPNIKAMIDTFPPHTCYRMRDNIGHYYIASYSSHDDGTMSLKMGHLLDSYLPGVVVFGVKPSNCERCDCVLEGDDRYDGTVQSGG